VVNRSTGALATCRILMLMPGTREGAWPVTVISTVAWLLPVLKAAGVSR
jgi:hypothetical protein